MSSRTLWQGACFAATATMAALGTAYAQTPAPADQTPAPAATTTAPAAAPAAPAAPPPGFWIDGIHLSAQLDGGVIFNPFRPSTGLNWGQAFTDHGNQAQLNQLLLTAEKPLDPKDPDYQWGFKVQFMYGSDARFTQYLGQFNNALPGDRYQFDLVEANVQAHLPFPTSGGMDVKVGQYATPLGYETINPVTNPFYSHSYIFQYGLPYEHTGALTVTHLTPVIDLYAGVDTGTNTTWGPLGDNNGAVGGIGGFNLTLYDGNLTILALSHLGPEQSTRVLSTNAAAAGLPTFNANGTWRAFNDAVITYKYSDTLTLTTEFNWARDSYGFDNKPVNAFGAAQYASYTLTDTLTLNGRLEVWRDDNNFFVAAYSGNNDPVRVQQGLTPISNVYAAPGGNTTYGALTLGVTYKPALPVITSLLIRPEIRWDHAFTTNNPFNQNYQASPGDKGGANSFTFGADAVVTF
nr:outer membrane beta-barrel protein [uncultured Rhodopila sp.]